jgi:hypothetical protein
MSIRLDDAGTMSANEHAKPESTLGPAEFTSPIDTADQTKLAVCAAKTPESIDSKPAQPAGDSRDQRTDGKVVHATIGESLLAPCVLENVTAETNKTLEGFAVQIDLAKHELYSKAIEIGKWLGEARDLLRYEEGFTTWVQERCGFSVSHAYRLIQAFEMFGSFPTLRKIQPSALFLLACGTTPESARNATCARTNLKPKKNWQLPDQARKHVECP